MKPAGVDCAALKAEAAKTGIIPPEAKQLCGGAQGRIGSLQMRGGPLSELMPLLASRLQRTVIDRTGLTGSWNLTLTYTPDPSQVEERRQGVPVDRAPGTQAAIDPNGPSVFTAMQEQLGLRLESTRAPVEVLVIARAEFPREN